ncbi:uncharacterized protein LOC128556881 [Mercenaria mercenaria]|uniref:uncharacterized protein LOC128556881 n=1 Tax=Mercenaria mercenaria TaxID=6596 RepID=UPI00234E6BD0|nr:uncharacterized protein LOC128556881 [Mercenaria mercenaria]
MHPDYAGKADHVGNNIVLLHLKKPFKITKAVKHVRLSDATYDREFLKTGKCKLAGFKGSSLADGYVSEMQVELLGARQCRKLIRFLYAFDVLIGNRNNICGISENAAFCTEHLGSPLVCYDGDDEPRLVGLSGLRSLSILRSMLSSTTILYESGEVQGMACKKRKGTNVDIALNKSDSRKQTICDKHLMAYNLNIAGLGDEFLLEPRISLFCV